MASRNGTSLWNPVSGSAGIDPDNGLTAYFLNPMTGAFRDHLPGTGCEPIPVKPDRRVPDCLPRPESEQYLRPWSVEDSADVRTFGGIGCRSAMASRG